MKKRTRLAGQIITILAFSLAIFMFFDWAERAMIRDEATDLQQNIHRVEGDSANRPYTNAVRDNSWQGAESSDRNRNVIGPFNRIEVVLLFAALAFLLITMALVGDKYSGRKRRRR